MTRDFDISKVRMIVVSGNRLFDYSRGASLNAYWAFNSFLEGFVLDTLTLVASILEVLHERQTQGVYEG